MPIGNYCNDNKIFLKLLFILKKICSSVQFWQILFQLLKVMYYFIYHKSYARSYDQLFSYAYGEGKERKKLKGII